MQTNPVTEAIACLGGMTAAVLATRIPQATWVRYRRLGRIADPARCFQVADLTGIPARRLAGLPTDTAPPEPPPAAAPDATTVQPRGSVRRLPRRRDDGPRVYGTIRSRDRNNCPLLAA